MTSFSPEDLNQTTPAWFFTRWITHFCAPIFVFLAGISSYLFYQKIQNKKTLSIFLLKRGIWLILLEILWVNFSWTLDFPTNKGFIFLQVIWVIGISMILLAALIHLPRIALLTFSALLVLGHNLLDHIQPESWGSFDWLWKTLHGSFSFIPITDNFGFLIVYAVIPWVAVMTAGYLFGFVFTLSKERRNKWLIYTGSLAILLFILLRGFNIYGDPSPWSIQERGSIFSLLSFLNVNKYPPSLSYLLMTIGSSMFLLYTFENWVASFWNRMQDVLKIYGKVPFFFYMAHFAVINIAAQIYHNIRYGESIIFLVRGQETWPAEYQAELWLTYLAWLGTVFLFYFLCRWYGKYKSTHHQWWLKYL